jgi:uroporphyrinogen III methyltransferase/synthase
VTRKSTKSTVQPGTVAFVGTGPGDPALLTLRAAELLGDADVVILDRLLRGDELLRHCRAGVEVLDGALAQDGLPLAHAARAKLAVDAARRGSRVVRLMDGDPATFHGLAREAAACAKARLRFEIVPGVSGVSAVPTYAGIPLTDTKTRAVHVVTTEDAEPDWSVQAAAEATLVVLGGPDRIADVARHLIAAGRSETTPVAVIASGTTTAQTTVVSTLAAVARDVAAAGLDRPLLTVVGSVVELREKLSWFETKPLFGWDVLVPRTKEQAGALARQLRSYGAVPQEVPTIAVEPPRTPQQMERAVKGLVTGRYAWIAFTSRNAVRAVRERFEEYGLDARAFSGIKIAAVGDQTASDLLAWGIAPDLVPAGEQSAAGLLAEWPAYDDVLDPIDRVFLPRADIATETLVAGLVELGWAVDDVTAYRTVRAAPPAAGTRDAIKTGGFDAVVFTSSSTVRNLVGIAGKPHPNTVIACIGPQTATTAEEHGLRVDVLAATPSADALAAALAEYGVAHRLAAAESGEGVLRPSQRRPTARRKAK